MEAKHLTFSYGKNTVLKDVSAKFKEKGITTLLGANGSGKSTLFNICTKNLTPERGIIILDGENIFDINQKKFAGKVAIVHQQNWIMGDINVRQLVSYGRTPYMKLMRGYDKIQRPEIQSLCGHQVVLRRRSRNGRNPSHANPQSASLLLSAIRDA